MPAETARGQMMARGLIGPSKLHSSEASKSLLCKFYGDKNAVHILTSLGYIRPPQGSGFYAEVKELPTLEQWRQVRDEWEAKDVAADVERLKIEYEKFLSGDDAAVERFFAICLASLEK